MVAKKTTKNTQPRQGVPDLSDFNKIDVNLTDAEVAFIGSTQQRQSNLINGVVQTIQIVFAEQLQATTKLFAAKKNITFDETKFAGVFFDEEKSKAVILLKKDETPTDTPE